MSKQINIGLIGFGTVGQGFYEIIQQRKDNRFVIKKIGIRDLSKPRTVDSALFTDRLDDILEDDAIDIVVEVIDDAEVAVGLLQKALANNKKVVTANKKAVAENYETLQQLQRSTGGTLIYEAAVAGSIPILQSLNNYFANLGGESIVAILNGSSNFILSQMEQQGKPYAQALRAAQDEGFAESDPTLDVSGYDARYKLTIINSMLFAQTIPAQEIPVYGIQQLEATSIQRFREQGYRIKPVAYSAKTEGEGLISWVAPALLPQGHLLAQLDNELNGVLVNSQYTGEQLFSGKGAGKFPTGSAVYNDVLAIADRNFRYVPVPEESQRGESSATISLLFVGGLESAVLPNAVQVGAPGYLSDLLVVPAAVPVGLLGQVFAQASRHRLNVLVDLAGFATGTDEELVVPAEVGVSWRRN